MRRITTILVLAMTLLAACAEVPTQYGSDGKPLPRLYKVTAREASQIPFRILDSVNALRAAGGHPAVAYNAQLNAAAETHSRDMARQNRPWHFGSDGSSPIDRVQRTGYTGTMLGENISETYETELETLSAWMEQPDTRAVILAADARDIGFAWFQESNGKIWWTLIMGSGVGTGIGFVQTDLAAAEN